MSLTRRFRRLRKGNGAVPPIRNKVFLEPLEPRLLLSSDLTYTAGAAAIDLTLRLDDSTQELQLIDNKDVSPDTQVVASQALADTNAVKITGADQDDKLTIDFKSPFSVPGGIGFINAFANDSDTLKVVGKPNLWSITGNNEGNVGGAGVVHFAGIKNLIGGADADTFIFALGGSLSGVIEGGASGDTLVGTDTANTWEIAGSDAGTLNGQVFTGIEILTGGAEADVFLFADGSSISGAVDGGGGGDTLDYSAYTTGITMDLGTGGATGTDGIRDIENIIGGLGADTLIGPDSDSIWSITGADAGTVAEVDFAGFENLTGGAGADTFVFADGSSVTGKIDGGAGTNTLDYSAYSTDVMVDLIAGTATGSGRIANIQNVTGGGGSDTLVGDSESNILIGGAGNDVLTGGLRADILDGGAGTDTLEEQRDAAFTLTDAALTIGLEGMDALLGIEQAVLIGGASANTMDTSAFAGTVALAGGEEDDIFMVNLGIYTVDGGTGNDTLVAGDGENTWEITAGDAGTLNGSIFTSIENLIGGAVTDSFVLAAGAMITGMIDGRQGEDRLKGGDAANSWIIDAANAGMFNGKPFKDIEDLEGGADEDVFLFAGGSIGSIDGGAGFDTLDYAADTAGVTIDLLAGTASRAGNFSNIENVVTGAGNDTIIGALSAQILNTGAGTDTLDFSNIASNLTITIHANGTVSVTDGINTVSGIAGAENIVGGSGPNTYVFEDGASLAGTISGSGATILDYSAYTTGVTVNLASGTATGTAGVSNVVKVVGGSGSDTLVGADSGATWNITGSGSGSVAGVSFSGIENLSGGSGADAFIFSGGSVDGAVNGGAGSDTLDYSSDSAGVIIDLSSGTATFAGGIVNIENVVTGAGNDTLIGALAAVILDTGAGTDTLDFSTLTSDLTVTIHKDGTISITDGVNTVSNISGAENIITGSGHNTFVFEDGASLAGSITGSGTVSLDYSAYTTDVSVNLAAGAATGTAGAANIVAVMGGFGIDTLIGPEGDATWNITGPGSGSVAGVSFTGIENLTGAADNQDTFVFTHDGSMSGIVEGGDSGFDTVKIQGGHVDTAILSYTGPDSGTIDLDGITISYSGMEPITITNPTTTAEINLGSAADIFSLADYGYSNDDQIILDYTFTPPMTFEDTDFANPSTSLTVNSDGGNDEITIEQLDDNFDAALTINAGAGADDITVKAVTGSGAYTINGDAGDDDITFDGTGAAILGSATAKGGADNDTYFFKDHWGDVTIIELFGEGTNDTLDFTDYNGTVTISYDGGSLIITGSDHNASSHPEKITIPVGTYDIEHMRNVEVVLSDESQQALLEGLQALVDWADELAEFEEIGATLPVVTGNVGVSIGNALDISEALDQLRLEVKNYFNTATTVTADGLEGALGFTNKTLDRYGKSIISDIYSPVLTGSATFTITMEVGESPARAETVIKDVLVTSTSDPDAIVTQINNALLSPELGETEEELKVRAFVTNDYRIAISAVSSEIFEMSLSANPSDNAVSELGFREAQTAVIPELDLGRDDRHGLLRVTSEVLATPDTIDIVYGVPNLEFTVTYDAQRHIDFGIDFGDHAREDLGVYFDNEQRLGMDSEFGAEMNLGLKLGSTPDFYLDINSMSIGADTNLSGSTANIADAEMEIGFLGTNASGLVDLDAGVELGFSKTGLTVSHLDADSNPLENWVIVTPTSHDLDIDLTVTVEEGLLNGSTADPSDFYEPSKTITLNNADPFDIGTFNLDLETNLGQLINFNRINASNIIALLRGLGNALEKTGDNELFSAFDIPFADAILSDVLDFTDTLPDAMLTDDLDDDIDENDLGKLLNTDGSLTFKNAQELAEALASALGLTEADISASYDTSREELTYTISLTNALPMMEVPVDFSMDLSPFMNFSSDSTVVISADAGLKLTFGVYIGEALSRLENDTELSSLNGGDGVEIKTNPAVTGENAVRTIYGRLSNDATFNINIGTDTYRVAVYASDPDGKGLLPLTDDNLTVDDLVTDIDYALQHAVDLATESEVNLKTTEGFSVARDPDKPNRIKLTSSSDFEVTVATGDPAMNELGLKAEHEAEEDGVNYSLTTTKDMPKLVGQLTEDATFEITIDDEDMVLITIDDEDAAANKTIIDLVNDVNRALAPFIETSEITTFDLTNDLTFQMTIDGETYQVTVYAADAELLGFTNGQTETGILTAENLLPGTQPGADVSFELLVDNTSFVVNLPKSTTDGNDADPGATNSLIADLNGALLAAGVTGVSAGISDGYLTLTSTDPTVELEIRSLGTTADNTTMDDLVSDMNKAIRQTPLSGKISVESNDSHIRVKVVDPEVTSLQVAAPSGNPLGLPENQTVTRVEASAMGNRLVLTSTEGKDFTVAAPNGVAVSELGLPTDPYLLTANTDDLIIYLSDSSINGGKGYYTVSLDGATLEDAKRLGDVIDLITTQTGGSGSVFDDSLMPGDVTVEINESGTGLRLIDNTFQTDADGKGLEGQQRFRVEAANGSSAAVQLGILKFDVTRDQDGDGDVDSADGDGVIEGATIGGTVLSDRFFIKGGSGNDISGTITLQPGSLEGGSVIPEDIEAEANYGYVSISLVGGQSDSIEASFSAELNDPSGDGITLTELINGLSEGESIFALNPPPIKDVIDVSATQYTISLDVTLDPDFIDFDLFGSSPRVDFVVNDFGNLLHRTDFSSIANGFAVTGDDTFTLAGDQTGLIGLGAKVFFDDGAKTVQTRVKQVEYNGDTLSTTVTVLDAVLPEALSEVTVSTPERPNVSINPVNFDDLEKFGKINFDHILDGLTELSDFFAQFETFGLLSEPLPVINQSISELIGYADRFATAVETLEEKPAETLQVLEAKLKEALGLPVTGPAALGFIHNQSSPEGTGELIADSALTDAYVKEDLSEDVVFLLSVADGSPRLITVKASEAETVAQLVTSINNGIDDAFGSEAEIQAIANVDDKIVIESTAATPGSLEIRDFIDLSLDESDPAAPVLRLDLTLVTSFSESLDVFIPDIDLYKLIPGIDLDELDLDQLVDLVATGVLTGEGDLIVNLDFGIDLGDPNNTDDEPGEIYLYDTTRIEGSLSTGGEDLAFQAGLGPFSVEISGGVVDISGGFSASLDPLDPVFINNRALIGEIIVDGDLQHVASELTGSVEQLSLPAKFNSIDIGSFGLPSNPAEIPLSDLSNPDFDINDYIELPSEFEPEYVDNLNLFDSILLAVDGIDLFLEGLQDLLDGEVFIFKMPLIGDALSDGARFIEDFRKDFVYPFRDLVETADDAAQDFADPEKNIISEFLYDLLGPSGIGLLLSDPNVPGEDFKGYYSEFEFIGLSTNLDDFLFNPSTTLQLKDTFIQWNLKLGSTLWNPRPDISFDIGIPGLGLKTEGEVELQIDWELDFGFGINFADGFYMDISDPDELQLTVDVDLPASVTGTLAFLSLTAEDKDVDGDGDSTGLSATFGIDILNRYDQFDDKLGFTEIFGSIGLDATLDASASAELGLKLGLSEDLDVAAGFPSVTSDFIFDWEVEDLRLSDFISNENQGGPLKGQLTDVLIEGLQVIEFRNITLDLGSFVSDVLGPVVDQIQEITEPIQPVIDVMTTPIPVISDLGPDITLLDLAAWAGGVDPRLLQAVADIITLINKIPDPSEAKSLELGFGDMKIYEKGAFDDIVMDLWSAKSDPEAMLNTILENKDKLLSLAEDVFGDNWFTDTLDDLAGTAADVMQGMMSEGAGGTAFAFPILEDPAQVYGLLMGNPAVLVTYDMPPLDFYFEWSQFFSIFGPLGVSISTEFWANIDFAFGYDTLGIQQFVEGDFRNPLLLLNGFYVSDTDLPTGDYGTDVPELVFGGGASLAAELNLGIARAGVAGGIWAEVEFDLYDPDRDGRVRIEEMLGNVVNEWNYGIKALAPLAIFDVSGEVWARLYAFLEIDLFLFSIEYEWNITPPITLLDFDIPFTRPPNLATEIGNDLQINTGEFAGQRLNYNTTDGSEVFTLWGTANSLEVNVNAFGFTQQYQLGGSTIFMSGGEGNDTYKLWDLKNPNITVVIDGGVGKDRIYLTNPNNPAQFFPGTAIIRGGEGDDVIYGGSGGDQIFGGKGDDRIYAGGGDDLVFGDEGIVSSQSARAFAEESDGNDTIYGGDDDDIIIGGGGVDTIYGGADDDIIIGDGGRVEFASDSDKTRGNVAEIRDTVRGLFFGGDRLHGGEGDDEIYGGKGDDIIEGGAGADLIFGEKGFDRIWGGDEAENEGDTIFGDGWRVTEARVGGRIDPDHLQPTSGGQADEIHGGAGGDTIYGGGGADLVHGDAHDDTIYGGSGPDELHGDEGDDMIFGQGDPDLIYGGLGGDIIDGGAGIDTIYGGASNPGETVGDDIFYGGFESDFFDGQGGSDTYIMNLRGAEESSLITVFDSGTSSLDTDKLIVNGTDLSDQFLLRASADLSGLAFVAMLIDYDTDGSFENLERINYDGLERMTVNGLAGDDRFAVDDVRAEATLNGGIGEDFFQIGQLYRSPRAENDEANIDPEDEFATIEVTRGFLSNGISLPMTINGGADADEFMVFHNKAVLTLNGGTGDDTFTVRAFALAGSQDNLRERTDISGGSGADLIQYAVNAPVNIDGGDGLDTVIIIGTEFADDFVVTEDGVYGAGLNVNFVGIEALRVDGAEGDDRFFVLSTGENFITEIAGGLGSDTFNMSGDTPPVISNDLLGHSGIITHSIEKTGSSYDETIIAGISANVADNDEPAIRITETGGFTVVGEDGLVDEYTVALTRQPTLDVYVKVLAPVQTPEEEQYGWEGLTVRSEHPDAYNEPDGSATTLHFTPANWFIAQEVIVEAPVDDEAEGVRYGAINHMVISEETLIGEGEPLAVLDVTEDFTFTTADDGLQYQSMISFTLGGNRTGQVALGAKVFFDSVETKVEGVVYHANTFTAADDGLTVIPNNSFTVNGNETGQIVVGAKVFFDTGETIVETSVTTVAYNGGNTTVTVLDAVLLEPLSELTVSFTTVTVLDDVLPETLSELTVSNANRLTAAAGTFADPGLNLIGAKVRITAGPGIGQVRLIESWTEDTLTLYTQWDEDDLPGAGSKFVVVRDDAFRGPVTSNVIDTFQDSRARFPIQVIDLADATVEITDGTGAGQSRTIARNTVNTITVTEAWDISPDETSKYKVTRNGEPVVINDEPVAGTVTSVVTKTFTVTGTGFPVTNLNNELNGLRAATIEITGGTGLGQMRIVESSEADSITVTTPWRTELDETSQYVIYRYDGLALPSVTVRVNDVDQAGVVITQMDNSIPDNSTDVIEGAEGETFGASDTYTVALTRKPRANVDVTVTPDVQIDLGGGPGVSIELEFTTTNYNDPQTVTVKAAQDFVPEGFHHGYITHSVTSDDTDTSKVTTDSFTLAEEGQTSVLLTREPLIISETATSSTTTALSDANASFPTDGNGLTGFWVKITGGTGEGQTRIIASNTETELTVTEDWETQPEGNSSEYEVIPRVKVSNVPLDPERFELSSSTIIFLDEDGRPEKVSGNVEVIYSYLIPGYNGVEVERVVANIGDKDTPGVLITESNGSTNVIECVPGLLQLPEKKIEYDQSLTQYNNVYYNKTLIFDFDVSGLTPFEDGVLTVSAIADLDWSGEYLTLEAEGFQLGNLFETGGKQYSPVTTSVNLSLDDLQGLADNGTITFTVTPSPAVNDFSWWYRTPSKLTLELTFPATLASDAEFPIEDTYTVVLTKQPDAPVTINVTPLPTRTTRGPLVTLTEQVEVSHTTLTFTPGNWDVPQTVTVSAIDDWIADGGDTKVFAPTLHTVNDIKGPLFIDGVGGEGSLAGLTPPVLLPADPSDPEDLAETNKKASTGDVVSATELTLTVNTDDVEPYGSLLYRTVEITEGPEAGVGQFRLIMSYEDNGDETTLTLNDPWDLETGELGEINKYAITDESLNFFVEEEDQVDFLTVFHEDSVANNTGYLEDATADGYEQRISGLGMGPDLVIDGVAYPGGITYGNLEVVEINLGSGNDEFFVDDIHSREDGFRTWTMLNTGPGDDDVTVDLDLENEGLFALNTQEGDDTVDASASTLPLVIFGWDGNDSITGGQGNDIIFGDRGRVDYLKERKILTDQTATKMTETTLEDGSAPFPGDSALEGYFVRITDSLGTAQVRRIQLNTAEVLTVSDPWTIDGGGTYTYEIFEETPEVVTRLGATPEPITGEVTGASETTLVDADASFPTDDEGLRGSIVWINDGTGTGQSRLILSNTENTLTLDTPWSVLPDGTSRYRITGRPSDQTDGEPLDPRLLFTVDSNTGGEDIIRGGEGEDLLIGGASGDVIDGNEAADLIFGDNVKLDRRGDYFGDFTNPRFRALQNNLIYNTGDNDLVDHSEDYEHPAGMPAWANWEILMSETERFNAAGDDYIAGGPQDDTIFGQLGDDTIQGDGSIEIVPAGSQQPIALSHASEGGTHRLVTLNGTITFDGASPDVVDAANDTIQLPHHGLADGQPVIYINAKEGSEDVGGLNSGQRYLVKVEGENNVQLYEAVSASRDEQSKQLSVVPSFEAGTDGDDYIEGNGGGDVIFGNLGQDDIIGGSSNLFSLVDPLDPVNDLVLRQDGDDTIFGGAGTDILRNDLGDAHMEDGQVVNSPTGHASDADMILGDNGNIYRLVGTNSTPDGEYLTFNYDDYTGTTGLNIVVRAAELLDYHIGGPDYLPNAEEIENDIGTGDEIHGESGDDFIYGMVGDDVLFGEGQDDDIIGGYGNDWISGGTGQDGVLGDDGRIYTSRNVAGDTSELSEPLYGIHKVETDNQSDYKVISTPGDIQYAEINQVGKLKKTVNLTPFMLGDPELPQYLNNYNPQNADDIIFGGWGDDFLHGGAGDDAISGAEALPEFYSNPFNPGDVLQYGARRDGEFAAYDEYDPWRKVYVNDLGWVPEPGDPLNEFLLNFDANDMNNEGYQPLDEHSAGTAYAPTMTDGDDVIFGDLGNDWLVGGTGKDHIYGGRGSDLLNADDDHDTLDGANTEADTHPSYEDFAYGGAGRDVLIANTGGDRLTDWAGEFNSYIVPYAPFGAFTIFRAPQPQLFEFLYDLSEADGADQTLGSDDARNGEPDGELGLVTQRDPDWRDQTGAPDDPQPGNIPGGARDVLRSATFNTGSMAMEAFATDSGVWTVENGALKVTAESLGGDAVSVFHVGDMLPQYFEIQASITMEKPTAGWKANSYVIFDYYSPTDFKFAGLNASIDKIQIGHRDESGRIVDVQDNMKIKPGEFYNVLVAINGTTVTLVADNKEYFSHTFEPRVIDGWVYGLNSGMVGFGSDNSRGVYDNIAVQVLPPEITFEGIEEFPDSHAAIGFVPSTGDWQMDGGRYGGTPAADGPAAISLVDLGLDHGFEVASVLELETTLKTENTAGLVFDYYGPKDFKFAAVDALAGKVVIGHYTNKSGWVYDATFDIAIKAGVDYDLNLSLKGSTVNLSVKEATAKNWQAMVGHVYNAVTVDGDFGLLSKDGSSSFDEVTVKTNDPAFRDEGDNLMAATAPQEAVGSDTILTDDALAPIVDEAIERLTDALGISDALVASLYEVSFQIVDFDGLTLGQAKDDTILIDIDAAGHGWFVDPTAYDDTEFRGQSLDGELVAIPLSPVYGDMDLLTVVMHELGHVLGFEDLSPEAHDLMSASLDPGMRRLPEDGAIASVSLDAAASSQIESRAEIDTRILGGLGFEHYSPKDSKLAALLADTNNGNRISSGWFIEVLARQTADAKARRDGNSFIDERSVNENDADSQTVDDGLTNLVQMGLSQEHDDADGSIAAVNGSEQGSWLLRWLLNGAEDDECSDPNHDIQVIL